MSRFAPRIVLPYEPRCVVLYAGDNDLGAWTGKTSTSIQLAAVTMLVFGGIVFAFAPHLVRAFFDDPELLAIHSETAFLAR